VSFVLLCVLAGAARSHCAENNYTLLSALEGINGLDLALAAQFLLADPFHLRTVGRQDSNVRIMFR